jgi:hypothetical protein
MDASHTPPQECEPFKELLADEARRRILLSVAFDHSWEMTPEGEDDLRIHMLHDPTAALGLLPDEFPRTFTARGVAPANASRRRAAHRSAGAMGASAA